MIPTSRTENTPKASQSIRLGRGMSVGIAFGLAIVVTYIGLSRLFPLILGQ